MNAKKTLALVLTLLMTLPVLSACSDSTSDSKNPSVTTPAPSLETQAPVETTDPTIDENGYLRDSLPELNFQGETVGILYWDDVERPEFFTEEITGDIVNDAIYKRNETVQNRLNVVFDWVGTPGNASHRSDYTNFATKSYNAGEKAYDIWATYSRTGGMLALNGLSYNLYDVKHLDFEKPWWPERMLNTCTIGKNLYFISGDISTNLLHFMYGVWYNRDLLEANNLPDPTEFVKNKTWTQDKLISMSSSLYADLNGNGQEDIEDQYGFTTLYYHCDAFYTGSGLRLVEADSENLLRISPDFSSEKCISMVEKLAAFCATNDTYTNKSNYSTPFYNGNALFMLDRIYAVDKAKSTMRDGAFSYGVLPVPLYDEKQDNYITVVGNPITLYSIAADCDDPDMAAAVLEAMCSAAYRLTTPALFETNLKIKYAEDSVVSQMFDIIHDTIDFDLGRFFSNDLNTMSEMPSKAITDGTPWASTASKYVNVLNGMMNKIVKKLGDLQ